MRKIPEKLVALFKDMGITSDEAVWYLPQNNTPVVNHKSLERVAAHLNITFDEPSVIESDAQTKTVVMLVTGRLGEKVEWSIGEAAPYNNKNGYPYAMAEKRAKDRVILKLIEVSGDVYSNEEAEDFKIEQARLAREASDKDNISGAPKKETATPPPSDEIPFDHEDMWAQWVTKQKGLIDEADSIGACTGWANRTRKKRGDLHEFSRELTAELRDYYSAKYDKLNNGER
jgi:hypothetical protein